ncbi:Mannose-P-dolichol utilization defect 1 protein [Holothuria leucospilota]|uniref:Mannose-P-dolichol utilization defect 1 protein homolog n=1 Tax=Holothuria leucospilota TaxID=206669 RepID=A0A9Q1BRC7_HOLLE|nr:Mannose-P-dolichol utilization defect 1 protein [Holothuria leucospilota]
MGEKVEGESLFAWLVMLFLPEECYVKFFEEFNFFDVPCLKIALSKGLGYGIIVGSLLVKIPQIIKIVSSKSGEGISLLGVLLELTAISATWSYSVANSFPFSTWGEALFLAAQTSAIGFLCLLFSDKQAQAFGFVVSYAVIMGILLSGVTPMNVLAFLQASNIFLILSAKLVQAQTNYSNGHTGQLSAITVFLLTSGAYARIFTTIQETGDLLTVAVYIVSALANSLILVQVLYYWNATIVYLDKQKGKKKY